MNWAKTRKHKRKIAGKVAKNEGRIFEDRLVFSANLHNWGLVQIPEGGRMISSTKFIKVKSPFDFIAAKWGKVVPFDAKSTKSSTFSYSNINTNQVNELLKLQAGGCKAGYIVHFRSQDKVVFFPAGQLKAVKPGTSLKSEDGLDLGSGGDIQLNNLL